MATPKRNNADTIYVTLLDTSGNFLTDPTIAAGDFQISKDGGAFANLSTTPTVSPSGSSNVQIQLSATERNADKAVIIASDVSGSQWQDVRIDLDIPTNDGTTEIDFTGADMLGWQRILYDTSDNEIARYNLYDENESRITGSASAFSGMISKEELV